MARTTPGVESGLFSHVAARRARMAYRLENTMFYRHCVDFNQEGFPVSTIVLPED